MISHLMGTNGIVVTGGISNFNSTYIDPNSSNPIIGMLRKSGAILQTFNGQTWINIEPNYTSIELDQETQSVLQWARKRMVQEEKIKALAKENPTLTDALLARDRAEDAVKILVALCDVK